MKNTVKSGIKAAKTAYNTVKTVKNTVDTAITQAKKIGTAIKNSEGGLTGILDTVGEVATASNTIFNTAKVGAAAVMANTTSIANDVQNAGKSKAELAFDQENQNRINELEKKMAAGNLSPEQMEYAKAELEQRKDNKTASSSNGSLNIHRGSNGNTMEETQSGEKLIRDSSGKLIQILSKDGTSKWSAS